MTLNTELLSAPVRISKTQKWWMISTLGKFTYIKQMKNWKQYLREGIFLNTVLAMKSWNLCA